MSIAHTDEDDPARWGLSLAHLAEIVTSCLDASAAKSIVEIGAGEGALTGVLLDWAADADARVVAVDATASPRLVELLEDHPELELIQEASDEALRRVPLPDAMIVDGDHNYHTVSEELRLIDQRAPGSQIPLLMFHHVGWPHGRRDAYRNPDRIPAERRQPMVSGSFVAPGEPGVVHEGLPVHNAANREGGSHNGVLTAIEDFLERRGELRLAVLPPFFGFAVVWHPDAAGARALAELLEPWDRDPVLERLEANRIHHLVTSHARSVMVLRTAAALKSQKDENAKLERLRVEQAAELESLRARSEHAAVQNREDEDGSATDSATIEWFHELWFRKRPVLEATFLGITTWQNPLDAWITQEIVSDIRPDLIIETGTFKGGSAALWASLLELVNEAGQVVSIDVDDRLDPSVGELAVVKRRVEFMHGSSTDPEIVREVSSRAVGKKVLAILDSDHGTGHVLAELAAYAPLICVGSYVIVQDVRAGPGVAIERFLQQNDRFEPDRSRERYMITNSTRGYLKRMS